MEGICKWLLLYFNVSFLLQSSVSDIVKNQCSEDKHVLWTSKIKYLLYDVNPGEGFNLRRDVYLRVANLVKKLNTKEHWVLVLPPWGQLYHWKRTPHGVYFDWKEFFDLQSLKKWVPVIELNDYQNEFDAYMDSFYILQHYSEGWGERFEDKFEKRGCIEQHNFRNTTENLWEAFLWGRTFTAANFSCLSFQGQASTIIPLLSNPADNFRSIFLYRAETLLHDNYGGYDYWAARRSMRFAKHLVEEAIKFRKKYLNSSDDVDNTIIKDDWRDYKSKPGSAKGGPYLAVHMRRRDFVVARKNEVPSIKFTSEQLKKLLERMQIRLLFVATDAPRKEFEELRLLLANYTVKQYKPMRSFREEYGDGGVAIVDQIICSHAKYFIGTYESTFSFRIQEEREIMGFDPDTTFNRLCGSNNKCEQPSRWNVVFS